MNKPAPPQRAPHYVWQEDHNWTPRECAIALIDQLCFWVSRATTGLIFVGDAAGRICVLKAEKERGELAFTSDRGEGTIVLTIGALDWVRAEVFIGGVMVLGAWVEDPYEEKTFWPDGADGVDEGPGRISKRGAWLEINTERFPGAYCTERSRYFQVEEDEAAMYPPGGVTL